MLDRCLAALAALTYPRDDFEVLVVDDGSSPPADTITERYAERLPLRLLHRNGEGPARARNVALHQARGDYVVFTDDDCAPEASWLNAYDDAFRSMPAAAFGGAVVDDPENGLCGAASQMLISFLYGAQDASGSMRFYCSNNLALPRVGLLAIGGFDPSFPLAAAEDRDLCARWLEQGEMQLLSTAVVRHRQQLTFAGFCRQHFRYGRGAYQFWLRRRRAGGQGNRIQPPDFYLSMLSYPFSRTKMTRAAAICVLFAISQTAGAVGYFIERRRNRRMG